MNGPLDLQALSDPERRTSVTEAGSGPLDVAPEWVRWHFDDDSSLLIGALLAMMDGQVVVNDATLAQLDRGLQIEACYDPLQHATMFRLRRPWTPPEPVPEE